MIGNWFLRFGALFGVAGVGLAVYAGYHHDPKFASLQSQVMMIGWIGMMLAGLYYTSISTTSDYVETIGSLIPGSAGLHFWVALIGAAAIVAGTTGTALDLTYTGALGSQTFDKFAWGEPLALAGSGLTGLAQLLFLINVLRGTSR